MNSALAQGLNTLNEVLEHLDPSLDGLCLSGTSLRTLATTLLDTLALLRESLATTTDPRLALELASTAQHLGFEASRMELVAAERANATAAHTLAQRELDTLREHPADTSTTPVRSTGRNCYRNPEELLAAWGRIPYAHTHRMVADALDLVGRKDFTGARVPPRFEHLSVLLFTPGMDPAAVRAVSRKLAKVEPADLTFEGAATSPTLRHADGRTVEEHAAEVLADEFIPMAAVKKVSTLILEAINKGGPVPPASLRRGLFALPIRSPYFREFLLRLSTAEGAWVDSWCASASKASTRAGRAARRNPASAAPSPPAGSSTGKGGRSGAPVPGDSFFRDPADNPNQPPAGTAGTAGAAGPQDPDTSTSTSDAGTTGSASNVSNASTANNSETGTGDSEAGSATSGMNDAAPATNDTTEAGNSTAEAAEAENGTAASGTSSSETGTSDSEAGSANNSTADATEAETGIDSNNNRTTDTANSAGTGTASSETGTTDSEAGSANGSTSDAECSTAEATEAENSTATSGTGTTGAESGASTGNNTTETGTDSTAGTTETEPGSVHGAGPDGQGAWSIQDLLPDDAEPFSWDDDDLFIPEATPPERALNALLEILLDANDPASGPVKDGGVSVQGGVPVQGSLFDPDPDPDQETDPDTGPVDGAPPAPPPRKSSRLRPVVVAHMMIDDLKDLARSTAQTAHGVDLPPAALRELLCQADLIPAVFNAEGVLLDFGRAQRFVPKVLQRAVLARDRYCLVPGCLAKVEVLEFHHTDPYALGGHTRLDRIVPGCKSHHIEFDHGVVKVVWVRGLPWVLLPRDRDPVQRLRRNYSPPGVPTSIELPEEFSTG